MFAADLRSRYPRAAGFARRAVGWMWLAGWSGVLLLAHRPWHELGGLLAERMRWLERLLLGSGFLVGCHVGAFVRDSAQARGGRTHLDALRIVWMPVATATATAMVVSSLRGRWDWTLLFLVAFLAYWAGLDASVGAWPLARGLDYAAMRKIENDPPRDDADYETAR